MDGANNGKSAPAEKDGTPESAGPQAISMDNAMELLSRSSFAGVEKFSLAMERFSVLSTEMITLLMGLSQEINKSVEELHAVRSAVEVKKKELGTLHETEQSVRALQLQKEKLEQLIGDRRRSWEEEIAQRESEKEEFRKFWAAEQFRARQELEEEIQSIRQQNCEVREAAEKELSMREEILKSKELEWNRLIDELDQLLTKLAGRPVPSGTAPAFIRKDMVMSPDSKKFYIPLSSHFVEEADRLLEGSESTPDLESALMWEKVCGEDSPAFGGGGYSFRSNAAEDHGLSPGFIKDVCLQSNRAESCENPSPIRDNTLLKFAPKNSNGLS